jgi:CBS domain-containing protein
MKARDIMTADPACCTPDDTARHAASLMQERDCGCIPVVEDQVSRRLIGVITDRDITLRGTARGRNADTPVRELMSTDVSCCRPDDDLQDVERIMAGRKVRRVPILDENDRCVGIVAQADLAFEAGRLTTEDEVGRIVEQISEPTDGPRSEESIDYRVGPR